MGKAMMTANRRMRAAVIILAVLVALIVMAAIMSEMYDKCGSPCRRGLRQEHRAVF
jgi:type II secretory pathway component PulK